MFERISRRPRIVGTYDYRVAHVFNFCVAFSVSSASENVAVYFSWSSVVSNCSCQLYTGWRLVCWSVGARYIGLLLGLVWWAGLELGLVVGLTLIWYGVTSSVLLVCQVQFGQTNIHGPMVDKNLILTANFAMLSWLFGQFLFCMPAQYDCFFLVWLVCFGGLW